MSIRMTTPRAEVSRIMKEMQAIMRDEMMKSLSFLGEQCVKRIRDRRFEESWADQTGNLRSSIGYSIYEHGRTVIQSAFPVVKRGFEGQSEGKKYVSELAEKYAKTYALVVVAAMSYAEYVEAIDGKDVLASTELWAKQKVESYLENAKQEAEKRIQELL